MKVALAQFSVTRGDVDVNLDRIREYASSAAEAGAEALFLPEMCSSGFDWSANRNLVQTAHITIATIQSFAQSHGIAVSGSFMEKTESGKVANTQYFIDANGEVLAKYRKLYLFSLFNEEKHVEAGDQIVVADTSLGRIGCSICYDLRFPELFRQCMHLGAEIQILCAAFPHPRLSHWQTLIRARAIENQSFFIAVNQCGSEGHGSNVGNTRYFGHSMVVDPWGEVLLEADESEGLFFADIDISKVAKARSKLTAIEDRRPELYLDS